MFRTLLAGEDLQAQRWRIIQELNEKIQLLKLDVTLVFDAHYQYGEATRSHFNHLEIQFTAQGETADDLILDELKQDPYPQQQTVVTSDKKLAWLARRRSAKTETVEDFLTWLNKRYKNKLRQQKTLVKRTVEVPIKKEIPEPKPKKSAPPGKNASPEECFDYYLSLFEDNFSQMAALNPPENKPVKTKARAKKVKKMIKEQEPGLSDEERWLMAFERNVEEDEER